MRPFRSYIATFLLLCFVRVLLPESAILALHRHEHTEKEVAHQRGNRDKAVLTAKHQHCPVDHLFEVPFQPAAQLVVPSAFFTYARPEAQLRHSVWADTAPTATRLRGPPARA